MRGLHRFLLCWPSDRQCNLYRRRLDSVGIYFFMLNQLWVWISRVVALVYRVHHRLSRQQHETGAVYRRRLEGMDTLEQQRCNNLQHLVWLWNARVGSILCRLSGYMPGQQHTNHDLFGRQHQNLDRVVDS